MLASIASAAHVHGPQHDHDLAWPDFAPHLHAHQHDHAQSSNPSGMELPDCQAFHLLSFAHALSRSPLWLAAHVADASHSIDGGEPGSSSIHLSSGRARAPPGLFG